MAPSEALTVAVDALAVRAGSAQIVTANLLAGWRTAAPQDRLIALVGAQTELEVPTGVRVQRLGAPAGGLAGRLWGQSLSLRAACARVRADALLSTVTAGALLGARGCPRAVIVYDLRHELRPEQFSPPRRIARRLIYGWSFRRADALLCISQRTRHDLVSRHPRAASAAHVMPLGADHALRWRGFQAPASQAASGVPYVLAFGQFANKNVDAVLDAWGRFARRATGRIVLCVCGLGTVAREQARRRAEALGIAGAVRLEPWLDQGRFAQLFAGCAAVLFASDFEGFGLPALEALALGIPVVISRDPALLEVTAGHAVIAEDVGAETLARAIEEALSLPAARRKAGVEHARAFTWERAALRARAALVSVAAGRRRGRL